MMEGPGTSCFPESMECQVRVKVQSLRNYFEVLYRHGICEHYQALFVVNHEESVIIRTRIGVQKFCNGSNRTEWGLP